MTCRGRLIIIGLVVLWTGVAHAQYQDITRPGDPVELVDGTNDGDGNDGPPPGAEGVEHVIDDFVQKYLNFKDLGSGFAVTPSANPSNLPVLGIRFYTANDAEPRDPASYVLEGSNDSITGPWTVIASGDLALPTDRNVASTDAIPPTGNLALFHQTVLFDNVDSYLHYRVTFPTLKDASNANSMQIAEVELLVPEPGAVTLALLGLLGLVSIRRRSAKV